MSNTNPTKGGGRLVMLNPKKVKWYYNIPTQQRTTREAQKRQWMVIILNSGNRIQEWSAGHWKPFYKNKFELNTRFHLLFKQN